MMPRLQAQEHLAAIRVATMGAGLYPDDARKDMLRELERVASGGRRQRARRPKRADLGAMGIGVLSAAPEAGVNDV